MTWELSVQDCDSCPMHNQRTETGEWCRLASLVATGKANDKQASTETYDRAAHGRMWWCPLDTRGPLTLRTPTAA